MMGEVLQRLLQRLGNSQPCFLRWATWLAATGRHAWLQVHGDIHSFLYTGSPAMHSHVLGLVVQVSLGYVELLLVWLAGRATRE